FQASELRPDRAQLSVLASIVEYVQAGRYGGAMRLANFLRQGWIGEDEARRRFTPEVVDEALKDAPGYLPLSGLERDASPGYVPGCLGLVQRQDAPGCATCPVKHVCSRLVQATDERLRQRFGSTDPREDRRLRMGRDRVRRHRERKRQQALATD